MNAHFFKGLEFKKILIVSIPTLITLFLIAFFFHISERKEWVLPLILSFMPIFTVSIVVIRRSSYIVNTIFSVSMFFYGLGILIAFIGFVDTTFDFLLPIGMSFFIMPSIIGIYISAKMILEGVDQWLNTELVFIIVITVFLSLFSYVFYFPDPRNNIAILFGETFLAFLFALVAHQFYLIEKRVPSAKNKAKPIIAGFSIAISGIILNDLHILLLGYPSFIRAYFVGIGMTIMMISFVNLSEQNQSDHENQLNSIKPAFRQLNDAIKNLGEYFGQNFDSNSKRLVYHHLTKDMDQLFRNDLKSEMSGLRISILLECGLVYPRPVNNKYLQEILGTHKKVISQNLTKLINLGYLRRVTNLADQRIKPITLTEKTFLFLDFINKEITKGLSNQFYLSLFNFKRK